MNRLIGIDTENGLATAESGIYGPALEKVLGGARRHARPLSAIV